MKTTRKTPLACALALALPFACIATAQASLSDRALSQLERLSVTPGQGRADRASSRAIDHSARPVNRAAEDTPSEAPGPRTRFNPVSSNLCPDSDAALVGPVGQEGASQVAHLDFLPAVQATGEPAEGASWARLMYFWLGTTLDVVANAHKLEPNSEWTLIVVAADASAICLGQGTANRGGQLHLSASVDPASHLPIGLDPFAERTDETVDATVQLVDSATVDCETGVVTAGEGNMLLGTEGLRFVDVDELVCPAPEAP